MLRLYVVHGLPSGSFTRNKSSPCLPLVPQRLLHPKYLGKIFLDGSFHLKRSQPFFLATQNTKGNLSIGSFQWLLPAIAYSSEIYDSSVTSTGPLFCVDSKPRKFSLSSHSHRGLAHGICHTSTLHPRLPALNSLHSSDRIAVLVGVSPGAGQ